MVRIANNAHGEIVITLQNYDYSYWMPMLRALIALVRNQSEDLRLSNNELALVYDLITELLPDDEIIEHVMHNKPELMVIELEKKESKK